MTQTKIFAKLFTGIYMKKKALRTILCIFFVIVSILFITKNVYSYENFDGRYSYSTYNELPSNNYAESVSNKEILFIVDYSASMRKSFGYSTRIFHAIDSLNSILSDLPDNTRIGLRVFGITDDSSISFSDDDSQLLSYRNRLCAASQLVVPINSNNVSNISEKLSMYNPKGATPIGYSLRQAVQFDFNIPNSLKHIILITDGRENCGDDPCEFIKHLMRTRNDIRIDVIGITLEENAYSQLSCIAKFANGEFYNIKDPGNFSVKIKDLITADTSFNSYYKPETTAKAPKTNVSDEYYFKPGSIKNFENTNFYNKSIKYNNYAFEFDI